jgi:hypothetical protein
VTSGRASALPAASARARRCVLPAFGWLALACILAAGCARKSVVIADVELTRDGGNEPVAGTFAEPPQTDGGASVEDARAGGGVAGSFGDDAGSGEGPPQRCELGVWFWPALAIYVRDCKVRVSEEWLLRWLSQLQSEVPIERSGESRQYEPCDYFGQIVYPNPSDRQELIVCPSVCALIKASVLFASEDHLRCLAEASIRR